MFREEKFERKRMRKRRWEDRSGQMENVMDERERGIETVLKVYESITVGREEEMRKLSE